MDLPTTLSDAKRMFIIGGLALRVLSRGGKGGSPPKGRGNRNLLQVDKAFT